MDGQVVEKFQEHFGKMKDPRVERTKLYPLEEILFVLLCGSICGAESWRDFVMFGQEKLDFLREYFPFSAGIPCKNTFARVSAALEPEQFRACFIAWAASLQTVPGEVIAMDGKTLCNSANACTGAAAIHMVSAFGTDSRLVLAQQKVAEKSHEITAIAALLDLLDVTGHIITIDAMGCQRSIAKKIRDRGADYVLALKGNQGTLNDDGGAHLCASGGRVVCAGGLALSIHPTRLACDCRRGIAASGIGVISSSTAFVQQSHVTVVLFRLTLKHPKDSS
jgi:hypothetical protein